MKKWIALLAAAVLLIGLLPAGYGEATEKHVADYGDEMATIPAILDAADKALADGMDPKKVGEEIYSLADAGDMLPYFTYICENVAAYGTENYEKMEAFLNSDKAVPYDSYATECSKDDIGFEVYEPYDNDYSGALKAVLAEIGTEFCFKPCFWTESDFRTYYGTDFKKFKPARAREGYVCVVVLDEAQSAPETGWNEGTDYTFMDALSTSIDAIMVDLGEDAPVLTGNPQLASEFWIFDLTYPFYAWYGQREIRGFDCVMSLSVESASTKKTTAKLQQRNRLPNTIYSWHDWMAEADVPYIREINGYMSFVSKIRTAIQKERSAALTNRKMTALNAESVLKSVLINQTAKLTNNWQKAIYESGARQVKLEEGTVTFFLRSYDPKTAELGAYAETAEPQAWLTKALENAQAYDISLTLEVEDGLLTKKSLQTLKTTVSKAAATAQKAWAGKDMIAALKDYFFPVPVQEKVTGAEQLMTPSAAFTAWADRVQYQTGHAPAAAAAAVLYTQKSQTLNVKGGPHEMTLTCTASNPASLLRESARAALDELAYVTASERLDEEKWPELLLRNVTAYAFKNKAKGTEKTVLTLDLDALAEDSLPEAYEAYLGLIDYGTVEDAFTETAKKLPEKAAIRITQSSKLSGGNAGTQVRVRIPKDGEMTYIQIRDYGSEAIQATGFVLPGKQVAFKIPQGSSYLVYCSGPYWYGEEDLFGELGSYNKSEELEIKSSRYIHTFTLETVEEGDVSIYDADPSDFR